MNMLIGYARVSTHEQNLDLQTDALKRAGCKEIFTDQITGTSANRPELDELKKIIRPEDTLVVWRLDRLGRSLQNLIEWANYLDQKKIGLKSLHESIDTTTSTGKLTFHIFAALAEFERNLIIERTKAGLAAARARGRTGGRKKVMTPKKIRMAKELRKDNSNSVTDICETLKVSRATLYRYLDRE